MHTMSYLSHLLWLFGVVHWSYGDFEPAYLKVCGRRHKHMVESNHCNKGVWLRQPIEPGCICARGVWALSGGFCDEDAAIIVGDGHCFHISFEIRTAKLIGDPKDPFKPKIYVAPMELDAVYEIKEGEYSVALQSDEIIVIGVNPRQVAQRKDFEVCLDLEPSDYDKPVHIFTNPRRSEKEWTLDRKKMYNCPITTPYQKHVAFGEMFSRNHVHGKLVVGRQCMKQCPTENEPDDIPPPPSERFQMGRFMTDEDNITMMSDPRNTFVAQKASTLVKSGSANGGRLPRPVKTMEERAREKEEMRAKATQDVDHYEKETNEQTLRMMHAHISPLLLNITGASIATREYKYFQMMRSIAEKACPEDYVPKKMLRGLMRMFRQLLWETAETFTHSQSNDDAQFNRTQTIVDYCMEKTPHPAVLFATYNESYKHKDAFDRIMSSPKPERCPVPILYAVNGSEYNYTTISNENKYIRNISGYFYPHLKFNTSSEDFIIETAWKVALIGQYRCSRYFNDSTAADFSHFFHQVQSFFNDKIVKRWYYQKSVDATLDIVKMIFPSYDINKFVYGLDACLFGVQGYSKFDYVNVWIQRPKIPSTPNAFSLERHVVPGSEKSRLSTLDYAPDPVTKPPTTKSRGKRSFASSLTGYYYMWGGNAKCLDNYMEPVINKNLGYRLPPGCVTPVPA